MKGREEKLIDNFQLTDTIFSTAFFPLVSSFSSTFLLPLLDPPHQLSGWRPHEYYMSNRLPLVVHSNPGVAYPRQPAGDKGTYIR